MNNLGKTVTATVMLNNFVAGVGLQIVLDRLA